MSSELILSQKIGLELKQFLILKSIIKKYKLKRPILNASIFGSRAKNNYKKFSDIDLLIEAKPFFSQLEKFNLKMDFEESNLIYKVDLVFKEDLLDSYKNSILENLIDI